MTNEDIIKELTRMRENFDPNSVYGSYCIDFLDAAIEALKEQPEHSQNTSSKQPDSETFGVKTGETCADAISRRAAIDAVNKICDRCGENKKYNGVMCGTCYLDGVADIIEDLPSAHPDGIPLEWINKHLEWLDNCDNDFAQLAKVGIRAMVELWKKDRI